jgi:putative transposase
LTDTDYVCVWVDGIHLKVRREADKVCLLVMIGVRAVGRKELVALADGFRESSQSWADLLGSCRRRGMTDPVLAVGDGALGFWKALREVFPDTREQRCWFHVSSNVLAALLKSAHPGAKAALAEIYYAEDMDHALEAVNAFEAVRLRQRVTKGPGSRAAGIAMAFKLIESAQTHWRAVNAPHLVALVRAGARFEKGALVERPDESGGDQQVA